MNTMSNVRKIESSYVKIVTFIYIYVKIENMKKDKLSIQVKKLTNKESDKQKKRQTNKETEDGQTEKQNQVCSAAQQLFITKKNTVFQIKTVKVRD